MTARGFLIGCTLLCGCTAGDVLPVAEILNHRNCHSVVAGLTLVTFEDVAAMRGSTLIGITTDPESEQPDLALVAVSKGPQPTPGYAFQLVSARQEGKTAVVELEWQEPSTDAVLAQVMTHPCLVVGIESAGYETLVVSDQNGVLGTIEL